MLLARARLIWALDFYPMNNGRLLLAFIVSPLAALLTLIVMAIALRTASGEILMSLMFYVPLAYSVAIILGLPAYILSQIFGWNKLTAYLSGGAFIGLITALMCGLFFSWGADLEFFIFCLIAGALSALVFWLILNGFRRNGSSRVSTNGEI
jgi:hypothetical protein